ncbi:hypothetical protein I4U23_013176 [Adineta vaga]|nr:hypothetical protein I4U23_013176 [Adineta vaga]
MLRLGTNEDFDALYPIYMHSTVNPYLSFEIMNKEDFLPIFQELIESDKLYIYEDVNGQVAATCIVAQQTRRCAHTVCLSTLATNPNCQRQGIGTKFVRELIDEIRKDKRIKRIELFAEADNEIGVNFYKKLGFQVEACLKNSFKRACEDHYVDELVLAMLFE